MWTDTRKYRVKGLKEAAIAVGGWGITSVAAHPGYALLFTRREARITIPKQRGTCTSLERALPWVSIVARPSEFNHTALKRLSGVCVYADAEPKFIRAQNIRFGMLQCEDLVCGNRPKNSEGLRTRVARGDLLVVTILV